MVQLILDSGQFGVKLFPKPHSSKYHYDFLFFQFFFDLDEFCSALNVVISGCVLSSAQLTILAIAAYSFFTCLTGTAIVFIAVTIQQHS